MQSVEFTKRIGRKTSCWNGFPNISVAGFYNPFLQLVVANSVTSSHLAQASQKSDIGEFRRSYSTILHEITHWLDHTSTLWGQRQLASLFNAINARLSDNEHEFWRIAQHYNETRRLHLPDYYHHISEAAQLPWDGKVWQYSTSLGVEYGGDGKPREDRPILFTRFSTNDGMYLCRVPLTMVALLEVSAVNSELLLDSSLTCALDDDQKKKFSVQVLPEYLQRIYDGRLAEYSAAAHCLANLHRTKDVYRAYSLASALSNLCLNLPDELLDSIRVPDELRDPRGRMEQLLQLRSEGAAFMLISWHGHKASNASQELGVEAWIEEAVISAGLPRLEEIKELTLAEMKHLEEGIVEGEETDRLKNLLAIGRHNFKIRGLIGTDEPVPAMVSQDSEAKLPPVLLGDDRLFCFPGNCAEDADELKEWVSRGRVSGRV